MSVITQMLTDLERRQLPRRGRASWLRLGVAANDARGRRRLDPRVWLILLMSAGALALTTDRWRRLQPDPTPAPPEAASRAADAAADPKAAPKPYLDALLPPVEPLLAADAAPVAPPPPGISLAEPGARPAAPVQVQAPAQPARSVLGSIRTGWERGRTRYVFKFDRSPTAAVLDQDARGNPVLRVANVEVAATLPPRPGQDRLLGEVSLEQGADEVRVVFGAARALPLEASFHRMSWPGDLPHWLVVDLREGAGSPPAVEPAVPANPPQAGPAGAVLPAVVQPAAKPVHKRPRQVTAAERAGMLLHQAREHLRAGAEGAAITALARALAEYPGLAEAAELSAAIHLRRGDLDTARAILATAIVRTPGHPGLSKALARILVEQGATTEAMELLERLPPARRAADGELLALLAAVYQRRGLHGRAAETYVEALRLDPARGTWWLGMAVSLEGLGRLEEAASAYAQSIASGELRGEVLAYAQDRQSALQAADRSARGSGEP